MRLPKVGDEITTDMALSLCKYYKFDYLVERIQDNPHGFKPWVFDGASMLPDRVASVLLRIPNLTEISLRHDLKYAYGYPGNDAERLQADFEFALEVLKDGATPTVTKLMFAAVDLGGKEEYGHSFSWGFARC